MHNEKTRPSVTAGLYIMNKNGEILMTRGTKWKNKWVPIAGHVEYGETVEETVVREAKEELGLDVGNVELLTVVDLIEPEDFTPRKDHFVGLQYRAELIDSNQEIVMNHESSEYAWKKPEDIVKDEEVEEKTRWVIENFLVGKKLKKGLLRKCKNCGNKEEEAKEAKVGWLRAQADYQNLQKEVESNKSEWAQYSERVILEEFIPVYDNFKKAFAVEGEVNEEWKKGIEYIMKQFADILKQHGVEEIKSVGEKFDPEFHEAVGEEEGESGVVVKEVDPGYMIKNKVLKITKVIVGK